MSHNISKPVNRTDNKEKLGGYAAYTNDVELPGMLYAKTLRSSKSRARILSVDIPELPEGYYIVDKNDVPGNNRIKIIFDDQPYFAEDCVNYIGQPILLVVGPDKEKINELIAGINVNYEDMAPIYTVEDAESGNYEPVYGDDNCFADYHISRGDIQKGFAEAEKIIEGEYRTGYQEHVYLEPQGMVAVCEDGKVAVYGSMQCPWDVKHAVVEALGWDSERVSVVQNTTGGAFGGKEDYPSMVAGHAAFAAVKTGRPVQLIFDRGEDIEATTKRHPSQIRIRTGLDKNNNIIAMDVDIRLNGGAYSGLSNVVLKRTIFSVSGVYFIPNMIIRGKAMATNNVPAGAFRGFGGPQAFFAIEMHMDKISRELKLDALALKTRHLLKKGDPTPSGGVFRHDIKLPEMIEAVDEISGFGKKIREFSTGCDCKLKGIGMSLFSHGLGFVGNGERDLIKSVVSLKKHTDGKVEILSSSVEMGQGLKTTFKKIVAGTIGIPIENIIFENPDTGLVPDSGPTVASRSITIPGKLLEEAAIEMKERWNDAEELVVTKNYKHPEYIKWDDEKFCGDAYPAYSWGANVVEVEVDPITYEIDVKGAWAVFDIGRAIDEKIVRGQIEGGMVQGLGYGSLEVLEAVNGKIQQRSITDYIIPTSRDFTKVESRLIENPYEYGPFGAKGVGELTLVGAAPALAAAVANATGVSINRLPVTPEYLMEVMENAKKS